MRLRSLAAAPLVAVAMFGTPAAAWPSATAARPQAPPALTASALSARYAADAQALTRAERTATRDGDTVWSEWAWHGTRGSGEPMEMAGVMVLGLRDDLISWARLYVEDVDAGAGIEAVVRHIAGT